MSLFQKARTATLAIVNEVADGAINKMPLPVLKQKIRDLEAAQKEIHLQLGVQKGTILDAEGEVKTLTSRINAETTTLRRMAATNGKEDPKVTTKASLIVTLQGQLKTKQDSLTNLHAMLDKMQQGSNALDAKHTEAMDRLAMLQSVDSDTKALNAGKKASEIVGGLVNSSVDGMGIDDMEKKITHDHNVASAQFDDAINAIHIPEDDGSHSAAVNDLLDSLTDVTTATASK